MASRMVFTKSSTALISTSLLFLSLIAGGSAVLAQEAGQKTFATPQDAGNALNEAVKSGDKTVELAVLGASATDVITSGDPVRDKDNADIFLKRFAQMNRWARESNGSEALYIGAENWPFPIALKKTAAGQWYFDTKDGVQEILYRRIGKNELSTIEVCNALVDGQLDYFKELHDGSTIHQYAQKFISEEGKQNGLYWKVAEGQPESPIGPLVAHANAQGYGKSDQPEPFHGYYYRMLTAQGANAPGGAKSYLVDGNMTGGFAFLAYPADYRNSGVMTFVVDANGVVYQKDLGPKTADTAKGMTSYNPDKTWMTTGEPPVADSDSN